VSQIFSPFNTSGDNCVWILLKESHISCVCLNTDTLFICLYLFGITQLVIIFPPKSFVFLWYVLFQSECTSEEHSNFDCKMFSWAVVFSI